MLVDDLIFFWVFCVESIRMALDSRAVADWRSLACIFSNKLKITQVFDNYKKVEARLHNLVSTLTPTIVLEG
jgi:hypothetical protein